MVSYLIVKVRYFFILCENNEEQSFFQIRRPGSFPELTPFRPARSSGIKVQEVSSVQVLFIN